MKDHHAYRSQPLHYAGKLGFRHYLPSDTGLPAAPTCASIESESVACFEVTRIVDHEITIDGHTFGPADNLQEHTLTVSSSDNSERGARDWGHWSPYRNTYISWGTSWVRNQEIGYYHYRGTTQAGANIYQGKRIIQTKLSYRKNGTITGTAVSNAHINGNGTFSPGNVATVWATDSPALNAPTTEYLYTYYTVNKDALG
jgi:hypothetical protein